MKKMLLALFMGLFLVGTMPLVAEDMSNAPAAGETKAEKPAKHKKAKKAKKAKHKKSKKAKKAAAAAADPAAAPAEGAK